MPLSMIGGKWKGYILWHLLDGQLRYTEIQRMLPGVSRKVLTEHLHQLEDDGLVGKVVFPESPPRVEYYLTERGKSLEPILLALKAWARNVLKEDDVRNDS